MPMYMLFVGRPVVAGARDDTSHREGPPERVLRLDGCPRDQSAYAEAAEAAEAAEQEPRSTPSEGQAAANKGSDV